MSLNTVDDELIVYLCLKKIMKVRVCVWTNVIQCRC